MLVLKELEGSDFTVARGLNTLRTDRSVSPLTSREVTKLGKMATSGMYAPFFSVHLTVEFTGTLQEAIEWLTYAHGLLHYSRIQGDPADSHASCLVNSSGNLVAYSKAYWRLLRESSAGMQRAAEHLNRILLQAAPMSWKALTDCGAL